MNADALSGIGELLAQYYLDLYHDSELVSLFIDRLTFESVCEEYCRASGLAMHDCCRYLHASPSNANTVYKALAIAAFQVMACNDVVNYAGVYDKLREKIPRLRHLNDAALMQDYFEGGQEEMWSAVYWFFNSKRKKIYNFPQPKRGSGRYVQYPLSQQLRTTSEIVRYADRFLLTLAPHAPYTFEEFKKRVSFFPGDSNELVKRLIFSFYQTWDGQSTADYKRKKAAGAHAQAAHRGQTVIEVDEASTSKTFSIFEYLSNSNAPKKISGKSLLNGNGFRLFEYTDYQDWALLRLNGIPQEMACLGILADSRFLQLYKSAMPKACAVYSEKNGETAFVIFDSEEACESVIKKLGLKKEELSVRLSGGIKVGYNTYSDEAMPVLHFREAQSEIYLNSEKIILAEQPLLQISFKELKARAKREAKDGVYSIKLPFCAPLRIRIARFSNNASAEPPAGFSAGKSSIDIYDNKSGCAPLLRGLESFASPIAPPREDELCEVRGLAAGAGRGLVLHKQSFERKFAFLRTKHYAR